jgi:trk system potassium uptake protein TrkH
LVPCRCWLAIPGLSVTDAYFEAMSGLTATGATVLTGLDTLPLSINVWRCFMVLVGGMGIIVLAVAILPLLGVGGAQLFKAETAGPMKDQKLTPRIAETARGLWAVYFATGRRLLSGLPLAGMSWADAFMHMCTTMGLGGFSSYDASFGHFHSPLIEAVAIVFMLLAGINFALYFVAWRKRSLAVLWRDIEARSFLLLLAGSVLLVAACSWCARHLPGFGDIAAARRLQRDLGGHHHRLRHRRLRAVAGFAPLLMILLGCFATCAGSTGGGIKMVRMLLLLKQAQRELVRIVHPRAVNPVVLGGRPWCPRR